MKRKKEKTQVNIQTEIAVWNRVKSSQKLFYKSHKVSLVGEK